jgi:acetylornithine deacetylase
VDSERVMNYVDKQLILDLSKQFIETPSPTGHEADFAKVVYRALKQVGMDAQLQILYEERLNAAGRVYGDGTGPTVMFSGHLDTSVSGDEEWLTGPGYKNKCVVVDDKWIYGNGIYNMKGALICYIAAVDALLRSGHKLKGDIIVAGTAGEVEKAAVDEFQGREYDSYGVGLRYLMIHGYAADYHILGEPTGNLPQIGRMGTVWAKLIT